MTLVHPFRVISASTIFVVLVVALLAISPAAAAVCGNAVVESGEDCDDGSSQNGGTNSCCTAACTFSGKSPDVIVGDLTGTTNYGTVGGITAYSVGTTSCNLGSCWLNWISNIAEHPVIGQSMYRLKDGRFEQIGQSWLKHGFTALTGSVCSSSCVAPPNGSHLGVNCSDPYSSGLNGSQSNLGPKVDVNPNTGVYPYPDSRIATTGNAIFKRLQVHNTDLDAASNPGAVYFVEGQYVTRDDAQAKNNANNASYRSATIGIAPTYNLTLTGSTVRQKMGIQAWKATDPSVTETLVGASEGLIVVSAKATSLGGGIYHYEYAVENLTNQRAGQSFTVPIPAGTVVTNVGFHDVDYHSGEPFDGTDWTPSVASTSVNWATLPFAVSVNANALRWGTLYNFRFDANQAPGTSSVVIDFFRPGTPTSVSVSTVTPGPCGGAPNGTACSDGNACTATDACQSGVCTGSNPVVCAASDACHQAGTCAPVTGVCSNPTKPDGTVCNDGSACTQIDGCVSGVCTGANPVVCAASDACHTAGTCAPATGVCSNPAAPDGIACSDGNACTQADACASGACVSGPPVVCTASDACHEAGTCGPATGVCSNPVAPDGIACSDGNVCTLNDACLSGVCAGEGPASPAEVDEGVLVSQLAGVTTITWNTAFGSTWSDVLRGLVGALPVGPGGGDEVCLLSGTAGTTATDPDTPNPDEGFWYLIQGGNDCGKGPFGFEVEGGVPTPRVSATCP
jgi:hypothetical protein